MHTAPHAEGTDSSPDARSSSLDKKWFQAVLLFILAGVILFSRADNLASYATADEPYYLKNAANFYYLLREGRFGETDLIVHPGVTTLWSGALAFWIYFPEYVQDEEATFPISDFHLKYVIERAGLNKESMLATSRRFSVVIQTALLVAAFYFGWQSLGLSPALLAILLVSFDPFYLANARILQPDGMLAACMLLSITALLAFLRTRSRWSLLVSGLAAGLAILSKVPGVFLLPMAALLFAADWWWGHGEDCRTRQGLIRRLRSYLLWFVFALLVIFVLWPVMWVEPGEALKKLFEFTATASAEVNSPMFFNGEIIPEGEFGLEYLYFYPLTFLWRTTPVVLVGFICGLAAFWLNKGAPKRENPLRFHLLAYLSAAVLFIGLFTLSAKKFDRYILPAMLYLDVVAALGYAALLSVLARRFARKKSPFILANWMIVVPLTILAGWQSGLVLGSAPYYHSYYNPWLGGLEKAQQVMMVGWGEGLDEAASYLNQKLANQPLEVYAFYSAAFDIHYHGRSSELPISAPISDRLFNQIQNADYVVIYLSQRQRNSSARILQYLEEEQAEYIIQIRGVDYVWVYNLANISRQ